MTGLMLTKDLADASSNQSNDLDHAPAVIASEEGSRTIWALSGTWSTGSVHLVDTQMRELERAKAQESVIIDISGVGRLDTAGPWLIERLAAAGLNVGADV